MEDLVVGEWIIPASEVTEEFDTPGGPVGQHANRTRSAVRLRFDVTRSSLPEDVRQRLQRVFGTVVEATSSDSRSQFRNRALARRRLIEKIEAELSEPTPRKPTRPSRAARDRRLASKRARSRLKRARRRPDVDD